MARLRQAGLQRRNLRGGLVGGLAGLLGFQRGGQTCLHPPFGDLLGLLLQRQVLLGDAQTVLLAAQFHIGLATSAASDTWVLSSVAWAARAEASLASTRLPCAPHQSGSQLASSPAE
jgi:hypothetical protein